jgi:N-acetylglucosamine-6-phosphate deacetylase
MRGAQPAHYIRLADPTVYARWLDLGAVKQVTVAPEFPENRAFIRDCVARGINVSIGHTQATYEDVRQAVGLGARQTTHTCNGMVGVHHRSPGAVGVALSLDPIVCELIADNVHVHPAILKLVVRAKGIHSVVLVTDAIRGAGMPDGQYDLAGQSITVAKGMVTLSGGTLAGSTLTMDDALRHIMAATGLALSEVWPMTSANAAVQIGLGDRKGQLTTGYDADVVLLDRANRVRMTMVEGRVVWRA